MERSVAPRHRLHAGRQRLHQKIHASSQATRPLHSERSSKIIYAIISDIHASREALEAVLEDIQAHGAQRVICLGDIVGFNADPNACVELIRQRSIPSVRGNHDSVAGNLKAPTKFSAHARRTIEWTITQLTEENKTFLASLPLLQQIDDFQIVHAALHPEPNDDTRIMTREEAKKSFDLFNRYFANSSASSLAVSRSRNTPEILFFGHTHHYLIFESQDNSVTLTDLEKVELKPGTKYLINPGAVGQSRDKDWRASWILYDSNNQTIHRIRTRYDRAKVRSKNIQNGLAQREPILAQVGDWAGFHLHRAKTSAKNFVRQKGLTSWKPT